MVKEDAKWIGELVGALCDPIIVMPNGWGETLPDWMKPAITQERLIANMMAARGEPMTGSDTEVAAYLYTASLEGPMGHDWTEIYLFIARKAYERHHKGSKMPEDITVEELTKFQEGKLNHLRHWIYDTRVKHRKGKAQLEKGERKKEEEEDSPQYAFDLGLEPEKVEQKGA